MIVFQRSGRQVFGENRRRASRARLKTNSRPEALPPLFPGSGGGVVPPPLPEGAGDKSENGGRAVRGDFADKRIAGITDQEVSCGIQREILGLVEQRARAKRCDCVVGNCCGRSHSRYHPIPLDLASRRSGLCFLSHFTHHPARNVMPLMSAQPGSFFIFSRIVSRWWKSSLRTTEWETSTMSWLRSTTTGCE